VPSVTVLLICLWSVASQAAAADRLALTNGDALTGQLRSVTAAEVVFASDLAGVVTLKRTSVVQLIRNEGDGRPRTIAAAQLESVVSGSADAPSASWNGAANGELAMNRGNSDTATVSVNGTATRLREGQKLATYGNYLLSTLGTGTGTTLARAARGGARYDRDIVRPLYGFGFVDVEHDFLQLLDLRTVVGGGAGVHLVNSSRVQANVFGGVSYARDRYAEVIADTTTTTTPTTSTTTTTTTSPGNSAAGGNANAVANVNGRAVAVGRNRTIVVPGRTPPAVVNPTLTRSVGEYVIGQDLVALLGDAVTLTQRAAVFPAVSDTGDYRVSFDFSLSGPISEHWQWHSTVSDRYLRIPPSGGAVRNDLFIATGLGVTFGRGDVGGYRGADTRVR
jgi:hypothetical protein